MLSFLAPFARFPSLTSLIPSPALAISACKDDPFCLKTVAQDAGIKNKGEAPSIAVALGRIIQMLLSLVGVIFFVLALWAGFRWMIARGNQEDVDAAKKTIENAAVGLVAVLISYALTTYIVKSLFAQPATPPPAPTNDCERASNSCKKLDAAGLCPVTGSLPTGSSCGSTGLSCCAP